MTRFVRLFRYDPVKDPTARLRLDYDPEWGNAVLADEDVLPECADDPDPRRSKAIANIDLTTAQVRWLATVTAELADEMERNDAAVQRAVDLLSSEGI